MRRSRLAQLGIALAISVASSGASAQEPQPAPAAGSHAGHDQPSAARDADQAPPPPHEAGAPRSGVPVLTDADRAAAFPDVHGHTVHDTAVHYLVLVDQLEGRLGAGAGGLGWDTHGWLGGDRDRLWFRTEGTGRDGRVAAAEAHLMYGRAVARWWDLVVGVRQDVRGGPSRTWAAVGVQGTAPYWIDVEATAYVGESGRTQLRVEGEYDLLLTNRLVLQPRVEANLFGRSDPERGIGRGLSSIESGLRLRYEVRRELAPYVGVAWDHAFFGTRELAEAAGRPAALTRLVVGARVWF
jgi:copper resistance protein B